MNVLVLGAGIIGTTSAFFLAKQGHNVTVVDRQKSVAMETSHANAGQLSYAFSSPWATPSLPLSLFKWTLGGTSPLVVNPNVSIETIKFMYRTYKNCNPNSYEINKSRMLRIANYSQKTLIDLESEFDINYEHRKQGSLQLFWSPKDLEKAKQDMAILKKFKIQYEVLDAQGCVEAEPGLQYIRNKLYGGLRFINDYTGNCYLFTSELYKKCLEMGVKFEFNTHIESIHINDNKVSSVKTNHGELTADNYAVSLGSHSPKILSSVGIDIPVYPVKGYSITLPVLNDLDAPQSTIMDDKNKVGITRLGNTIRVAGIAHLTDHNSSLREKSLHSLKKGLNNLFPHAAKETNDINFWTGFRPSTPDSTPIIGATPYSNLYLNTGHGTLGWTMSLGSGKLLANIVSGNEPEISLEGIDMSRYKYSNKTNLNYG
ncbi:D-amino acid dehydrogenase [Candidatus Thioglobus sp.]|nr:D-amino acid dehydrogenase [Candidatus Thioglobus sp.]